MKAAPGASEDKAQDRTSGGEGKRVSWRGGRGGGGVVCWGGGRDPEATCRAVERDLRRDSWTGAGEGWRCRVAAADSGGSASRGRDGSGRWLWGFTLILTVVIDFGGQG